MAFINPDTREAFPGYELTEEREAYISRYGSLKSMYEHSKNIFETKKQHEILDDLLVMIELDDLEELNQSYTNILKKIANSDEDVKTMATFVYYLTQCRNRVIERNEKE